MCERLSDRMPAVAAGLAPWTADERAHLAECADCAAEWRLVEVTGRLGRPSIDAARVSAAVRDRLAAEPKGAMVIPIARRKRAWLWGLAAAAVLVLAVSLNRSGAGWSADAAAAGEVLTELDELTTTELELVLAELEEPDGVTDGGTGDLSTDELQQVLQEWES
ncbi:MAG: hypothetical protein ACKVZ0_13280 [Gemmatimonadales bacterium]